MSDQAGNKSKIPLTGFLADFNSSMPDKELRDKYGLSARSFVSLIKALLAKKLITPEDLAWRKQMAVQRDLAKESNFLSGLYICPHCNHPHPIPFEICPACGGKVADASSSQESPVPIITPSGGHFIIDENSAIQELGPVADYPPTEPMIALEDQERAGGEPIETLEEETQAPAPEKASALDSVKSFFSKFKKK